MIDLLHLRTIYINDPNIIIQLEYSKTIENNNNISNKIIIINIDKIIQIVFNPNKDIAKIGFDVIFNTYKLRLLDTSAAPTRDNGLFN